MSKYGFVPKKNAIPAVIKCPICGSDEFKTYNEMYPGDLIDSQEQIYYCSMCSYKISFGNKNIITKYNSEN